MKQKDKELLLKDLCARLPYGVKCTTKSSWNGIYIIEGYKDNRVFLDCPVYDEGDDKWMIESIVPYLRPMSSMTEEEETEYHVLCYNEWCAGGWDYHDTISSIDWLNAHYFDFRNLIGRGLAIDCTGLNIY